jgi:hypothetical protein
MKRILKWIAGGILALTAMPPLTATRLRHYIHHDRPEVVVEEVQDVVSAVRGEASTAHGEVLPPG